LQKREGSWADFATVIGQCSEALCNHVKAHQDWNSINAEDDAKKLIELIRTSMTLGQTRQYDFHSWVKASLIEYKQGKHMSNQTYKEKLKECVVNMERLCTEVGYSGTQIEKDLSSMPRILIILHNLKFKRQPTQ
jgi:hypothetical protein